jgi:hypothetical protein
MRARTVSCVRVIVCEMYVIITTNPYSTFKL